VKANVVWQDFFGCSARRARANDERRPSGGQDRRRRLATAAFAKDNPSFLKAFAGVIDKYQTSFVNDKAAWAPDSDNAKLLAKLLGGTPQDQASALKNLSLLPIDAQLSDQWLGGGEKSGIAKILKDTSVFLKDQKKISDVLPSFRRRRRS
jgi:taurine transport system substrate-binding protein